MRLREGRCWTLFTALQELKGFEEPYGAWRPRGVVHAAIRNRSTWADERAAEAATLGISRQPYCLIVGGGQGGIAQAARLKRLSLPTLVIDGLEMYVTVMALAWWGCSAVIVSEATRSTSKNRSGSSSGPRGTIMASERSIAVSQACS